MKPLRSWLGLAGTFALSTRWALGLCLAAVLNEAHGHAFERLGDANGLDAQVVSTLLVDRQGYLWVGSREGLYRYDGYRAMSFASDPGDPATISDTDVRYIYESSDHYLWISTNTGGLNRYDPATGSFQRFQHDPADPASINDNNVYSIAQDGEGVLWISTDKGVARMTSPAGQFERFTHDANNPESLSSDRAYALQRSEDDVLWIATIGGGINRWNPESETFSRFDLASLASGPASLNDVFALRDAGDGRLWAGTRAGLVLVSPAESTARRIGTGPCEDDICPVPAIELDEQGVLWVATMDHGVFRVEPENLLVEPLVAGRPGDPGNLPARPLLSLEVHDQTLFAGTWGAGVFRAHAHALPFELIGGQQSGGLFPNETITAVQASDKPGKPWVGSFGGGVLQVNVERNLVLHAAPEGDPAYHAGVMDLALAQDGRHHAATSLGLATFSESAQTEVLEQHDAERPGSIGAGYLNAVLLQENGDLWVGSGGSGLYRRRAGDSEFDAFLPDPSNPDSLSGDYITALLTDGENSLWVGTRSNGLNRCRIEPWVCRRFDGRSPGQPSSLGHFHVTDVFRSRNGRLWVATNGGGLHEVEFDDQNRVKGFKRWTVDNGLLANGIMAIAEDSDESLWLSTRLGLSRLDPDTDRFINHVAASGLPASHFNAGAAASDSRFLYFGSTGGLLVINRGTVLEPRQPSPVRPTLVQTAAKGEQLTSHPWDGAPLTIPYGQLLSLEFAVLDFTESSHEYAYRFDTDEPWTELGNRRVVSFFGLAPGRYRIQARGRDAFGLWGESGTIDLWVKPPFWMQTWFRLTVVVLLILATLAIHQVRLARERRIAREVRRLGEKRESALEAALGSEAELAVLTPRQKEVFQLLAEGYSAREISELLDVSIKTVQAHRANLMERLELSDLASLVRLAIRTGIVSPRDQ